MHAPLYLTYKEFIMCHSNQECKSIRKNINLLSLDAHEIQVEECYACILGNNTEVNHSILSQTDYEVRLSYVDKYYEHVKSLRNHL